MSDKTVLTDEQITVVARSFGEGRTQTWMRDYARAIERAVLAASEQDRRGAELVVLLPGTYYMDSPDGGSVSVYEQLRRMSEDAERYRILRDSKYQMHEDDICVSDASFNTYFGDDLDIEVDKLKRRYDAAIAAGKGS